MHGTFSNRVPAWPPKRHYWQSSALAIALLPMMLVALWTSVGLYGPLLLWHLDFTSGATLVASDPSGYAQVAVWVYEGSVWFLSRFVDGVNLTKLGAESAAVLFSTTWGIWVTIALYPLGSLAARTYWRIRYKRWP